MQNSYLFPFDKIPANKKLVIYGASMVGQCYQKQIEKLNYGTIVAWVDRDYKRYKNMGVKSAEILNSSLEYDYIVIAAKNEIVAKSIIDNLSNMNVDTEKVIWSLK